MNKQTRWGSFLESFWNMVFGMVVATLIWHFGVVWLFDNGYLDEPGANFGDSIWITVIFTFVSLARSYLVRRASVAFAAWRSRRVQSATALCYNRASQHTMEDPLDGYPT